MVELLRAMRNLPAVSLVEAVEPASVVPLTTTLAWYSGVLLMPYMHSRCGKRGLFDGVGRNEHGGAQRAEAGLALVLGEVDADVEIAGELQAVFSRAPD